MCPSNHAHAHAQVIPLDPWKIVARAHESKAKAARSPNFTKDNPQTELEVQAWIQGKRRNGRSFLSQIFQKKTLNSERKMYGASWLFYSALKIMYFDIHD